MMAKWSETLALLKMRLLGLTQPLLQNLVGEGGVLRLPQHPQRMS